MPHVFFIHIARKFQKPTSVTNPVNFSVILWLSALTHTDTIQPDWSSFWQSDCLLWKTSAQLYTWLNFLSAQDYFLLSSRRRPVSHPQKWNTINSHKPPCIDFNPYDHCEIKFSNDLGFIKVDIITWLYGVDNVNMTKISYHDIWHSAIHNKYDM